MQSGNRSGHVSRMEEWVEWMTPGGGWTLAAAKKVVWMVVTPPHLMLEYLTTRH